MIFELGTVEGTRDVQCFSSDNNDTLTRKELLGDDGSKSTQQMSFSVDNDDLRDGWIKRDLVYLFKVCHLKYVMID